MELNIPIKYRNDIEKVTNFLKKEGCGAVYLFGSMLNEIGEVYQIG